MTDHAARTLLSVLLTMTRRDVTPAAKLFWVRLALVAPGSGMVQRSQHELAKDCGVSPDCARKSLAQLVRVGLLRKSVHKEAVKGNPTTYWVVLEEK